MIREAPREAGSSLGKLGERHDTVRLVWLSGAQASASVPLALRLQPYWAPAAIESTSRQDVFGCHLALLIIAAAGAEHGPHGALGDLGVVADGVIM